MADDKLIVIGDIETDDSVRLSHSVCDNGHPRTPRMPRIKVPKNFIECGKGAYHAELCAVVLRCSYRRGTAQHVRGWPGHRAWHGVEPPTWTATSCSAGLVRPTGLGYRLGWLASLSEVMRLAALATDFCGQHSVVAARLLADAWDTRGLDYPHRPIITAVDADAMRESAVNGQRRRLASLSSNLIRAGGSHD